MLHLHNNTQSLARRYLLYVANKCLYKMFVIDANNSYKLVELRIYTKKALLNRWNVIAGRDGTI